MAHASLVVRVCGGNGIDPKRMISWATRLFGDAYFLSVVSDFAVEPQWRPEWILPKILVADLCGRVVGAWRQLPQEVAPPSWKERVEKAYAWIVEEKIGAFAQYPSVLQGTRRPHRPTLAEFQSVPQGADGFLALAKDPTANTLLSISPFIEAFGFPNEATGDVEKVLASIRSAPPDEDDKFTVLALSLLAHIAVLTENAALADSITEACLERARRIETQEPIFEIVCRLIECTAAIKDRAEAARTLARRLEILAFIIPATRPKTVVEDDQALCIAKFNRSDDRWNYAKVEHAMLVLAKKCGISAAESRVAHVGGKDVLLVQRFDRFKTEKGYARARMISGLTRLQADENERDRWSYISLAEEIRRLVAKPSRDTPELFRRVCFNALISNIDDHPRNHALIAKEREWNLSPAYDLTPSPVIAQERRDLAMTCGDKGHFACASNILSQHTRFLLGPVEAQKIVETMRRQVSATWYDVARAEGVSERDAELIRGAFVYKGFNG